MKPQNQMITKLDFPSNHLYERFVRRKMKRNVRLDAFNHDRNTLRCCNWTTNQTCTMATACSLWKTISDTESLFIVVFIQLFSSSLAPCFNSYSVRRSSSIRLLLKCEPIDKELRSSEKRLPMSLSIAFIDVMIHFVILHGFCRCSTYSQMHSCTQPRICHWLHLTQMLQMSWKMASQFIFQIVS